MVNAHCHLELSYMAGMIPAGCGFIGFARGMGERRGASTEEERKRAIVAADAAMWREGIGAVGDVCNGVTSFETKRVSPIRYINFLEIFGLQTRSTEVTRALADRAKEEGLDYTVTPHSCYSVPREVFAAVVRGDVPSNGDFPLSIHFMESISEEQLFYGRGAMAEWYAERGWECDFLDYGSPAGRVEREVPPDRKILLVHGCCATDEVIKSVSDHFSDRVTWVLCPGSNRYISDMLPPVQLLRRSGVRIAVGTDSLASNWTLSIVEELKRFNGVPLEELLCWATCNGAEALGIGDRIGSFERGRRSGVVLLSGIDWERMALGDGARTQRIL